MTMVQRTITASLVGKKDGCLPKLENGVSDMAMDDLIGGGESKEKVTPSPRVVFCQNEASRPFRINKTGQKRT